MGDPNGNCFTCGLPEAEWYEGTECPDHLQRALDGAKERIAEIERDARDTAYAVDLRAQLAAATARAERAEREAHEAIAAIEEREAQYVRERDAARRDLEAERAHSARMMHAVRLAVASYETFDIALATRMEELAAALAEVEAARRAVGR